MTSRPRTTPVRDERGASVAIEIVLIMPLVVMLISFVVIASQVALTKDAVANAAGAAARAATQERSADAAQSAAQQVATATLQGTALVECLDPRVSVDTSGFSVPVGQPAQVQVQVNCTADRAWAMLSGGQQTYTGTGTAPLDNYRER